jgi:hypothetical protein
MHCCRAQRKLRPAAATVPALFVCAPRPRDDSKQTYGGTSPGPLDRFSIRSTQPPLSARLPPAGARRLSLPKGGAQMPLLLARRDVEPTASDPPRLSSIHIYPASPSPASTTVNSPRSFIRPSRSGSRQVARSRRRASERDRCGTGMPPNGQDVHGRNGGAASAAPAAPSKMDCFLTAVCTPLNLQVGTAAGDTGG